MSVRCPNCNSDWYKSVEPCSLTLDVKVDTVNFTEIVLTPTCTQPVTLECGKCHRRYAANLRTWNNASGSTTFGLEKPRLLPTEEESAAASKAFSEAYNQMSAKIAAHLKKHFKSTKHLVSYSAYESVNEVPQDNLDQVAIKGPCILAAEPNPTWGGESSKSFASPLLENPTWLELAGYANEMIRLTKDHHHVFFEGVDLDKKETNKRSDGVKVYQFVMGS